MSWCTEIPMHWKEWTESTVNSNVKQINEIIYLKDYSFFIKLPNLKIIITNVFTEDAW